MSFDEERFEVNNNAPLFLLVVIVVCCTLIAGQKSIPGGSFVMGDETGNPDEQPAHEVTLSPFSIATHEVTEAAYDSCVRSGRCTEAHYDDGTCRVWNGVRFIQIKVPAAARNGTYPVVCVTWQQARQYCRAQGLELPTEAQWEYAARAGGATAGGKAVAGRTSGPMPTGSGTPNGWGLYDMLGNAWEWVNDFYDPAAYRYSTPNNPKGPDAGFYRVIRGGGWYSGSGDLSVYDRQWYSPGYSEASIGFRCVGH